MKVLFLTKYGRLGASSRMRAYQYFDDLKSQGVECISSPLITDFDLLKRYRHRKYHFADILRGYLRRLNILLRSHTFDLIWIQQELFPYLPTFFENQLLHDIPYIVDSDDAVFQTYRDIKFAPIRFFLSESMERVLRQSTLAVVGNSYLKQCMIDIGAPHVEILPTVVDASRYIPTNQKVHDDKPTLVWIGSPTTTKYLELIKFPLAMVNQRFPFRLRIIGGSHFHIDGVDIESLPWSETTETNLLAESDIGIMPLDDTPWSRGKCAYKLIQYMAAGLPVVASSVGANKDVVLHNQNGFLCERPSDWCTALPKLIQSHQLRSSFGLAGRERVEKQYSLQVNAPILKRLFDTALQKEKPVLSLP